MTKFKYQITKKRLSWENSRKSKICEKSNCLDAGNFKAPKSRLKLNEYYFFCLKHIKEYNKSWDFYKGLSVDQIEISMRKDTVWDRPSWPLKGNPNKIIEQLDSLIKDDLNIFEKDKETQEYLKNKLIDEEITNEEHKSLKILGLSLPTDLMKIKKKYKKLVKIYHPDVNINNKKAEERFREINESYKTLLKRFIK